MVGWLLGKWLVVGRLVGDLRTALLTDNRIGEVNRAFVNGEHAECCRIILQDMFIQS